MKVSSHLVGLYHRTVRRYRKLAVRLNRETNPSTYRYAALVQRLRKLRRKIEKLHVQLKIAAATGVLIVGATLSSVAQTTNNGPFVRQPRHLNPLREPFKFKDITYPAVADIDKDGDLDILVADRTTTYYPDYSILPMRFMRNVGTNENPVYEEQYNNDNPFRNIDIQNRDRGIVFADIDNDGDQDLVVGLSYDTTENPIRYYRNDNGVFNEQTGAWNPATKAGNPFRNIAIEGHVKLAFGDLDNDGDLDVVITGAYTDPVTGGVDHVSWFRNDGTGTFTRNTGITLSGLPQNPWLLNPALSDVDGDGDLDLVFGGYYITPIYYEQVSPGNFVERTDAYDPGTQTGNPFSDIYFPNTQPVFADLDGDGDADLLLGEGDGDHYYWAPVNIIHYYKNAGNGLFEEQEDLANPLGGVDVSKLGSPVIIDLDGDSNLDAVLGHKYNEYYYGYNTPAHYELEGGEFVKKKSEDTPLGNISVGGMIAPAIVDLDGDGDLDFITGGYMGALTYFRNNNGSFTEVVSNSPFAGLDVGFLPVLEFADLDGDGDLDLVVGERFSQIIRYFENTGSRTSPTFTQRTGAANPFESMLTGVDFLGFMALHDVDHDGDIDVLASEIPDYKYDYNVITYYENTGTPTEPKFEFASQQPFLPATGPGNYVEPWTTQPYMADFDNDGDLDLFIGDYYGVFTYVSNENPAVVTTLASGAVNFVADVSDHVVIDPSLTLEDEDDDLIVLATVTIEQFEDGDVLQATPEPGITASFDPTTGILTLSGKATRAAYQTSLRTVSYRRLSGTNEPSRAITFRVYDTDFTTPEAVSRELAVFTESGTITVFNAIAPSSTGDNKFMRVANLPAQNTVTIFNRWGDEVFKVSNYDNQNPEKRFDGHTTKGDELATGTYFYEIEIGDLPGYTGPKRINGFIFLKR